MSAGGGGRLLTAEVRREWEVNRVRLAEAFCREMAEALSAGELAEVNRRNASDNDPMVCHSHDFCDANVVMAEAWAVAMGKPHPWAEDVTELDVALWDAAWTLAILAGFDAGRAGAVA